LKRRRNFSLITKRKIWENDTLFNKSTDDATTTNDQNAQSLYSFSNGYASFASSSSPLLCTGTEDDSTEEEEEEEDGFFGVWMASMCTADCLLVFFVRAANTFLLDFFPFPSNEEPAQKIELLVECDAVEALCIILAL
jgi:hypothetical protein